jgi:hypothetical protein
MNDRLTSTRDVASAQIAAIPRLRGGQSKSNLNLTLRSRWRPALARARSQKPAASQRLCYLLFAPDDAGILGCRRGGVGASARDVPGTVRRTYQTLLKSCAATSMVGSSPSSGESTPWPSLAEPRFCAGRSRHRPLCSTRHLVPTGARSEQGFPSSVGHRQYADERDR